MLTGPLQWTITNLGNGEYYLSLPGANGSPMFVQYDDKKLVAVEASTPSVWSFQKQPDEAYTFVPAAF